MTSFLVGFLGTFLLAAIIVGLVYLIDKWGQPRWSDWLMLTLGVVLIIIALVVR